MAKAKTEKEETKPKAKTKSKALAKVEKEPEPLVKFEKREFYIIRDHELAKLIKVHFDDDYKPSLWDIAELCKWSEKEHEICVDCDKKSTSPLKIGNERDLILYLVHKDVLAPGNWIVLISVE